MLFAFIFVLFTSFATAETVQIHSVHTEYVKLRDGRVAYTRDSLSFTPGQFLDIELDENHEIVSVSEAFKLMSLPPSEEVLALNENPVPTVLRDYTSATNLLMSFNPNAINGAQCYDKAHVWTYEALYRYGIHLSKAWLFFSDNYIARYRFKWWFHVAPITRVIMKGKTEERVLDREFATFPMQYKVWTDKFMENKFSCKFIQVYSDYSQHPGEDDCYILRSSPYFWQPKDLESFERTGTEKKNYIHWEINWAYRYGFGLVSNRPVNQ